MASEEVLKAEYKAALAKDCEVNNELKARKRALKAAKAAVAEKSKKVNEKHEEQKKTMLEKFWRGPFS